MKTSGLIGNLLLITLLSTGAQAQTDDVQSSTKGKGQKVGNLPYEVIVRPRVTRRHLRQLIVQVEEDFFDKFNELNIDDAYDVKCYKYTPTMSHIRRRICEPNFQIKERGLAASQAAFFLSCSGPCGDKMGLALWTLYSPKELRRVLRPQFETLQGKLEELTRSNAEFRQIGNVLAELKDQLENFSN